MTDAKKVLLSQLQAGAGIIKMMTADLTDEEYFTPVSENGVHTAWALCHLARTEDFFVSTLTGTDQLLPPCLHDIGNAGGPCETDASKYPSRTEIDKAFADSRAQTVAAIDNMTKEEWDATAPEGLPLPEAFTSKGLYWGLQAVHQFWHIGQIASCRTAMNKPKLITREEQPA